MKRYIRKISDPTVYTTVGYLGDNYPVPDGYEMVDGEPPRNGTKEVPIDVGLAIRTAVRLLDPEDYYLIKDELTAGFAVLANGFDPVSDLPYLQKLFTEANKKLDAKNNTHIQFAQTISTILNLGV